MKGMGNDLIRDARKRSRLTQQQLADLAGTTQSSIARLESGRTAPSFDDVIRILRLMHLDLDFMLVERDDSDWAQALDALERTEPERIDHHRRAVATMWRMREAGEQMRSSHA